MLKFLTDENIARSVFNALRDKGFDVFDIKEERLYGINDKKILNLACRQNRIIVTHDKDFLDYSLNKHRGLILLRFDDQSPKNVIKYLISFLRSKKTGLKNKIIVINEGWVRIW